MALVTRSGRPASQHPDELARLIEIFWEEEVTRYLEIGARHGDTFDHVMSMLPIGSFGVAVDLPGGKWGARASHSYLRSAVAELNGAGYDARTIFGDSTSPETIERVEKCAPFDAVLIDGDHLYDGAKADWLNYGPMARMVVFHDIAGEGQKTKHGDYPVEVPRLWNEIRGGFRHEEIIAAGSTMGIGVLWRH